MIFESTCYYLPSPTLPAPTHTHTYTHKGKFYDLFWPVSCLVPSRVFDTWQAFRKYVLNG